MQIQVEDCILFVFFCVSIPLYILILITLRKNRKNELLNGPFFVMAFYLGISQIIAAVSNWFLFKIRMLGLFYVFYRSIDPFAAWLGTYNTWLMPNFQVVLVSFITANRFTSIVWPLKSSKVRFVCATHEVIYI